MDNTVGFDLGDQIRIEGGGVSELKLVAGFGSILLDGPLEHSYGADAVVTKTMAAEDLAAQQAADEKKRTGAIVGGVVGGLSAAGLVAGLAAGLTATKKPTTTFLPHFDTWTTMTTMTTSLDGLTFVSDAGGGSLRGLAPVGLGSPSAKDAASPMPESFEWVWWGASALALAILACVLFVVFRRKLLAATKKEARAIDGGDWSPSTEGSAPCSPDSDTVLQEVDSGSPVTCSGVRQAWDKLFDLLDRDGDGHVTQEDFARAPVATRAVVSVLQGAQQPPAQSSGSALQSSTQSQSSLPMPSQSSLGTPLAPVPSQPLLGQQSFGTSFGTIAEPVTGRFHGAHQPRAGPAPGAFAAHPGMVPVPPQGPREPVATRGRP